MIMDLPEQINKKIEELKPLLEEYIEDMNYTDIKDNYFKKYIQIYYSIENFD